MYSPSVSRNIDPEATKCLCGIAVGAIALSITFIVLGVLGHPDIAMLKMAPIGSQIMIGLGSIAIIKIIASVVLFNCKNE